MPVLDAYSISGIRAGQAATDAAGIMPFSYVAVANADPSPYGTATVVLSSAANGVFSYLGVGTLSADGTTYTVSGSTAAIQAALRELVFTPTARQAAPGGSVATGFRLTVADAAGSATDASTSVVAIAQDTAPTLSTVPRLAPTLGPIAPFADVTITDPDPGATEAAAITLSVNGAPSDANGTLSGAGLTKTGVGTYRLAAAAPAAEQEALEALTFSPVDPANPHPVDVTLRVSDNFALSALTQWTLFDAPNPLGAVVTTNSTFGRYTYDDRPVAQAAHSYATTIDAVLNGTRVVYEQSFDLPFSDPSVQAAVAQAESNLRAFGASPGAAVLSASNLQTLSSTTTTAETSRDYTRATIDPLTTTFGPNFLGPRVSVPVPGYDSSGQDTDTAHFYFYVVPGQLDLNVNGVQDFTIHRTVTTSSSDRLTQHYVIFGAGTVPIASLAATDPATTNASEVHYLLTLSEPVRGLGTDSFRVSQGGSLSGAAVSGLSQQDATNYAVTVSTGIGSGSLSVTLPAAGSGVADATGNPLAADVAGPAYGIVSAFEILDTSTGQRQEVRGERYGGPVAALQYQYVYTASDNLNVTAGLSNAFIHTGAGFDAIDVSASGGTNVLDGGTNSNFLVGGAGAGSQDTFFTDDRSPSVDLWSTVANFHAGDAATVWGITAQDFVLQWVDGQGAGGYTGLTLHATAAGEPTASLTLSGYSTADLSNGRLTTSFGAVDGSSYLYIQGTR